MCKSTGFFSESRCPSVSGKVLSWITGSPMENSAPKWQAIYLLSPVQIHRQRTNNYWPTMFPPAYVARIRPLFQNEKPGFAWGDLHARTGRRLK